MSLKDAIGPVGSGPMGVAGPIGSVGVRGVVDPLIHKIVGSDGRTYQVMVGFKTIPNHSDGPAYIFRDEADLAKAYIEMMISMQQVHNAMNGG